MKSLKLNIEEFLKKPTWLIFIIVWVFYLVGLFLFSQLVWDSNTYLLDYKGADFEAYLSSIRRIDLLRYSFSPLWIVSISAAIWLLIKAGLVVMRTEIDGRILLKIVLLGAFILSFPFWVKSIWFILIEGSYTPDDLKYFFPGSLVSFIDIAEMKMTVVKAIARFNLFHLGFVAFTSLLISMNSTLNYIKSFAVVFFSYGSGLTLLQVLIIVMAM